MPFSQICSRFLDRRDGNVAVIFSLAFPVLLAGVGLAIDSAGFYNQQARMQSAADSTALAVAKEIHLFVENPDTLKASGESRAEALLAEKGLSGLPHVTEVRVNTDEGHAQVEIAMQAKSFLPVETWDENPIRVKADARTFGEVRLCVLGLHESDGGTIQLKKGAIVTAPECAVQSNSSSSAGLRVGSGSTLVSMFSCTSGGYQGSATSFVPEPETDCPVLDDPLSLRAPPPVGGCDYLDTSFSTGTHSISPGTYCGGLKIVGSAEVTAEPGVYIMTDGDLRVDNNAVLQGEDVGFYFAGDASVIKFKDKAVVELSAEGWPAGGHSLLRESGSP